MRRIITFTILALTLAGGVALADRDHRGHDRGRWDRGRWDRGGRVVHRDNYYRGRIAAPGWQRPYYRTYRRPVFVNNGYFRFHNGYRYAWSRPVIHRRYFDYRVQPQIIVENYQPIAGYTWIRGQWQWNGGEWLWVNGHYEPDQSYVDPSYSEPSYADPSYSESSYEAPCNDEPAYNAESVNYPQY